MALLTELDPGQMLGDLPDTYLFSVDFADEIQNIENQLSDIDAITTVLDAIEITDILVTIDGLSSDFDSLIDDFTGFDFASPVTDFSDNTSGQDGNILNGQTYVASASAAASAISIDIPSVNGISISPPGSTSTTPTLPNVVGANKPQGGGGVNAVVLKGTTSPNNPDIYLKGTAFTVTVSGPPNVPVYAISAHNGQNHGQAQMGVTDSKGKLVITGSFSAADVGSWTENWYLATTFWAQLVFEVV